ncbi:hypothetical protein DFQ27_000282 [Actinomortierella ambigua]|uniref:VPS9 domain-containing protein n=1 Tax=Actinomortierella ambigua TaxID=1343610 RepID=A0A9P6QF85_9FUNG|nr:hypothetical protein DFQ27_000282 [Actinomortierella ambigua]
MDLALSLFTTGPTPPGSFARQSTAYPTTTPNHFLSLLLFHATTSFPTASLISHDVAKLKNFQYLRKTFESVYATMVRERSQCQFVILCPINQSLMGKNELLGTEWEWGGIDEDFVTSHIVRIPHRETPETRNTLPTFNGRSLIVTDTTVTTAKGFRQLKQARLVEERIVYDNDSRGWIVYLIDRSLVGIHQGIPKGLQAATSPSSPVRPDNNKLGAYSPLDRTPTGSPSVLASQRQQQQQQPQQPQLQRLPAAERAPVRRSPRPSTEEATISARRSSQDSPQDLSNVGGVGGSGGTTRRSRLLTGYQYPSYQNWTNARGAYALVHRSHRAPRPTITLPTVLQRLPGLSSKLEQTIMTFNDETMIKTDLDDIRNSIDQLLAQVVEMLNQVDPNVLLGILNDHNMTVDGLNLLVEDYILNSTYDIVFFKITLQLKQQDWELAEAIRELHHLDLAQVGLTDTLTNHRSLVSALNEFQSIGILRTPKEKLQCLVQYVRVTSALSGGGADDLIPILLLTILRSGISNLASNLYYMKHFVLFGDSTSGEYGYSLSTLEAVSRYIQGHVKQLAPLSRLNQEYWRSIREGDLDKVTQMREDRAYLDITASALLTTMTTTSSAASRRTSNASLAQPDSQSMELSDNGLHQAPIAPPRPPLLSHPSSHSSTTIKAAPFNSRDAQGNTDVLMACKANQMDVLRFLLEQQHVSANVSNFEGTSLLMLAVELEQYDMAELILQHLTKPRQPESSDAAAAGGGSGVRRKRRAAVVVGEEESSNVGLNHQNVFGQTAVHVSVERGSLDLLNLILQAQPDVTLANNDGDSPLILASKLTERDLARYKPIVQRLVEAMATTATTTTPAGGCDSCFDQVNNHGDSALHYLADPELISLLVAKGANPDVDNYAGWTPLLKWALHDDTEAVKSLIHTDHVDYLMTDSRGYTALHMACLRGNVDMARMLLVQEKREGDNNGTTTTSSSTTEKNSKPKAGAAAPTASATIHYRMPVDLQSLMDGATPLQLACQSGAVPVVDFLLQMGANPQLRDWANETPTDMTNDAQVLELLDNASLFWDTRHPSSSTAATTHEKDLGEKRVIRVVRGAAVGQQGRVQYIVKSGSANTNTSTRSNNPEAHHPINAVVTMERSLDDFKFLRKCLLVEYPDICIPSLEGFYSPFLLSPSRPSKIVMSSTTRRLDMFLNYLSDHPLLRDHELLWEFMLMPELQKEMISTRSQTKQESALDTIYDSFSHHVDHLENEEEYFKMLQQTMVQLDRAIKQAQRSARKLHRSIQDVPQQLEDYAFVLENADQVDWSDKSNYLQALRAITATQSKMHTSDIESIGNLFEDFSFVVEGTLRALQHPQEIIASLRTMRKSYERLQRAQKRSEALWHGLSTISEGALSAIEGAGAAIGAAGQAATSFALTTVGVAAPLAPTSTSTLARVAAADPSAAAADSAAASAAKASSILAPPPPEAHLSSTSGRRSSIHGRAASSSSVSASSSFRSLSTLPVRDLSPSSMLTRSATLSRVTGGKTSSSLGMVTATKPGSPRASGASVPVAGQPRLEPSAPTVNTTVATSSTSTTSSPSTTTTTPTTITAPAPSSSSPLSFFTSAPSLSFLPPLPLFSFGSSSSSSSTSTSTTTTAVATTTATTTTAAEGSFRDLTTTTTTTTTSTTAVGSPRSRHPRHHPVSLSTSSTSTMMSSGGAGIGIGIGVGAHSSSTSSPSASSSSTESALEELELQMRRASSRLNAMHGSLADELAHLQHHHTQALERAMRDFGQRQLKIERSRLRDMMEILTELRWQVGSGLEEGGGGGGEEEEEVARVMSLSRSTSISVIQQHASDDDHEAKNQEKDEKKKAEVAALAAADEREEEEGKAAPYRVVAGSGRIRGSGPRNLYGWTGASGHGEETQLTLDAALSMQQQPQHAGEGAEAEAMTSDGHRVGSAAAAAAAAAGSLGRGPPLSAAARRRHGSEEGGQLVLEEDEKAELKLWQRQMEIQQSIDESLVERRPSPVRRVGSGGRGPQMEESEVDEGTLAEVGNEDSLSEKVSLD